jgi:hypothetical protein
MVNNTNRVKGVEVLFTILFLVVVSGTLHAQTATTTVNGDTTGVSATATTDANNTVVDNTTVNTTTSTTVGEDYFEAPDAAEQTTNTAQGR